MLTMLKKILSTIAALSAVITSSAQSQRSETILKDWEFRKGHDIEAAEGWEAVSVPHDWAIYGPFDKANDLQTVAVVQNGEDIATEKTGRTGGLPYMGKGTYRRTLEISEAEIRGLLETILFEFPVNAIGFQLPSWVMRLDREHPVRRNITNTIRESVIGVEKIRHLSVLPNLLCSCEYVHHTTLADVQLGTGNGNIQIEVKPELFYQILGEVTGVPVTSEGELMSHMTEMAAMCKEYQKIKSALDQVNATGYGIVMPSLDEMSLDEPEIIKQSGRYGIRLRATAPSIHMMKADITTEVAPIVGSERQSEELVNYLLREFEENPSKIWDSNIFGTSLYGLVNEGLHNKLYRMPSDARIKLKETVERIINDGCNGLICIIV